MEEMKIAIGIDRGDQFGEYIRTIVDGEQDWPPSTRKVPAEIEAERRSLARGLFQGAELVDLVGHSTPIRCCLKLGDWVLDRAAAERLASYLPESVAVVRLIGCGTASTEEGRAAAAALTRFRPEAYGTLHKVYSTHFDRGGVKKGIGAPPMRRFVAVDRDLDSRPSAADTRDRRSRAVLIWAGPWRTILRIYRKIRRLVPSRQDPQLRISELLDGEGSPMPGLLTEPLFVFGVASRSGAWTLEVLFDFECARFYSNAGPAGDQELVYKIRGFGPAAKTPLERYLERGPRGVTLIRRHEEAGNRCDAVPPSGPGGGHPGQPRFWLGALAGATAVVLALVLFAMFQRGVPVAVPIDATSGEQLPVPIDATIDAPVDAPIDGLVAVPSSEPSCATPTVTYTHFVSEYTSPQVYDPETCPLSIQINDYSASYVGAGDASGGTFVEWADAAPTDPAACAAASIQADLYRPRADTWTRVSSQQDHGTWDGQKCQLPLVGWRNRVDAPDMLIANSSYRIVAVARTSPTGTTRRFRVHSEIDAWIK